MAATVLYTPRVLGLATGLAEFPWDEAMPLKGSARSRSCGSTLELAVETDAEGRIARIGLRSRACAIGQAAAAIFAQAVKGRTLQEVDLAGSEIEAWLAGEADLPDWPGLDAIEAARDYPARHGAILLAWNAARELLPST